MRRKKDYINSSKETSLTSDKRYSGNRQVLN